MNARSAGISGLIIGMVIGLLLPSLLQATIFECATSGEGTVYTDDPSGLTGCRSVKLPPSSPQSPAPDQPAPAPPVIDPPRDEARPEIAPASRSDKAESSPTAQGADISRTDPQYEPPQEVHSPGAQTCTRGMNRLNPFDAGPCAPTQSPPPGPIPVPYESYFK